MIRLLKSRHCERSEGI